MAHNNNLILSSDVFEEVCDILHIKDRKSNKLVITLELNEAVKVENHTYACKGSEDE